MDESQRQYAEHRKRQQRERRTAAAAVEPNNARAARYDGGRRRDRTVAARQDLYCFYDVPAAFGVRTGRFGHSSDVCSRNVYDAVMTLRVLGLPAYRRIESLVPLPLGKVLAAPKRCILLRYG